MVVNEKMKRLRVILGIHRKNDSSSYLATCMCEGVGEDLGYGIG